MANIPSLAQAVQMSVKEVSELPIDILAILHEEASELRSSAKRADDHLFAALSLRFAGPAADARKLKGVDTGTIRLEQGGFTIIADLPKKVTWNNDGLSDVAKKLAEMGEPIEDYISVKRDVSERAYSSWPASLRRLFDPHRTVAVGKAGFRFEAKKDAA